jgi:hypothetical protein
MSRFWVPLLAAVALGACSTDEGTDGGGGGVTPGTSPATPAALKVNVNEIIFNGTTLQVNINYLDSTPRLVDYERVPLLDTGGYIAFMIQEDALDRLFVALARQSDDGSLRASTVADGGQFNRYFGGGVYARTGDFQRPAIGTGPGAGQVSYAGSYAAVTNVDVVRGSPTDVAKAVLPGTDPVLIPGQSSRVSGDIFFNVNFLDDSINGAIYNRVLIDQSLPLADIVLVRASIAADGTFLGGAEYNDGNNTGVGVYGGIFGGVGANSLAGLVNLDEFNKDWQNEREHGVFVLTQCGPNNTLPVCTQVAPFP